MKYILENIGKQSNVKVLLGEKKVKSCFCFRSSFCG